MNIRNKKLNGVIIALIFVAILVATGPLNKVMKRVLNDLSDVTSGHTYLTASFKYLDKDGKRLGNVEDKIYVFLSKKDGEKNRVALTLKANEKEQKVTKIYDQNGNEINKNNNNGHEINGKYTVTVAVPKDNQNTNDFNQNSQFDWNKYYEYKDGDSYNGSYIISYKNEIEIKSDEIVDLNIDVKERDGDRLLSSYILSKMNPATNFGVFALKFSQYADIEATVGVQTFERNGNQTFGLSDSNYKPLQSIDKFGSIKVEKIYTKNLNIPVTGKSVTINLKDSNNNVHSQICTTNEDGTCSVEFKDLNSGTYTIEEKIGNEIIDTNKTIIDESDKSVEVKFSKNTIEINKFTDSDKIMYNYNYVASVGSDVNLAKMRKPGTLVLGTGELVKKYENDQEFKNNDEKQKVIVKLAGTDGYPTINFNEEFDKLKNLSLQLATAIDSDDVKVYYKSAEEIKNKDINFKSNKKEYILVNVDCSNTNEVIIGGRNTIDGKVLNNTSFEYDEGAKIIYNFYTKSGKNIESYNHNIKTDEWTTGIILAPDADVEGAKGNHSGTIIAKNYTHKDGEVHQKVKPKWLDKNSTTATITNNLIENDEPKEPTEPQEPEEPDTPQEEEKERNVSIGKVDANKNLIEGAELELRDKDGNVIDSWTSTTELHKIIKELVIGEVYTVHEVKAPGGYQLADDYTFIYNGEENIEYAMVNTKVIVNKLDENQSYLPGAELRILDSEGSIVEQWVTDDKEHYVNHQLKVGETYTLHEEKAPEGYKTAEDVKFVYEPSNENQVVEMKDQKIVIGVFIEKKNMNDELLSGAHLQVLDSNGNIVDEWVSNGTVHRVNGNLNIGETYTLHEEEAPEGYEVSPDVSFEVKNTEEPQIITMTDNKIIIPGEPTVVVSKKDEENKFLEGATLQILDKDGKVIEEWTTNDKEHTVEVKLNIGETYTLHEVLAPTGYKVSDDVEFTVKDTLEVQEVKMIDKRIKKVAGVVETLDKINNYLTIFFVSLSALLISFIVYSKYNKKKLS